MQYLHTGLSHDPLLMAVCALVGFTLSVEMDQDDSLTLQVLYSTNY